jgi:phosphoglycerate kinase
MGVLSVKDMKECRGLTVMVRAALNVPVENGAVTDGFRLEKAMPTVAYLTGRGARVVLISHMSDTTGSLKPIYEYLKKKIALSFVSDVVGPAARSAVRAMKDGDILMLENIRWNSGEEANDEQFARELASMADVFVDDDFTVAHRKHAGVVGVPKFLPSYAGIQFAAELEGLSPALNPISPSLAIIGGAKFVTKELLIHTLLAKYDKLFIGGAIVNDFFLMKGYEVGKSLVSRTDHVKPLLDNPKIILPFDVTVLNPNGTEDKKIADVHENDAILDIGPESMEALMPEIQKAKTILWNGPMGNFENGYRRATDDLAKMISKTNSHSIVGGGDTLASIQSLNLMNKFTFVSTAGGAMLDFLANGTLPGIEALKNSKQATL